VTQALLKRLPSAVGITATDLNRTMPDFAARRYTRRRILRLNISGYDEGAFAARRPEDGLS
jgi:hypothetical protein